MSGVTVRLRLTLTQKQSFVACVSEEVVLEALSLINKCSYFMVCVFEEVASVLYSSSG